ncbi:MAG: hypothetical protein K6F28_08210 [Lachnospiraceae bacterium]|nr:hypothetical protein [Lachnospiraceae bacterium]
MNNYIVSHLSDAGEWGIVLLSADEVRKRMESKKYGRYYIYGYALLFVIETGVSC